tara:strand:+ start:2767 stop:3792 length:1026 start_codon:yes stop_codon:yes gene_type:complete
MGNYRIAVIPKNFTQVSAQDLEIDSGTLSVDASNNRVGVGTTSPGAQLEIHDTTTSSANTGGSLRLSANDGAVMGDSHRLGVIEFTGAEDTSNTQTVGARIEALTDAAWTNAENGCALYFYTTDGNASQTSVLKLDSNKKATFAGNMTADGSVSLKEKADAIADTAAYGQLWVKTATPNQLYFTTDAGDDIQLTDGTSAAGGSGMTNFILEDGDGTEVTVSDGKEVKFVEGDGMDIDWTDTSTGSDGDPYDLTFTVNLNNLGAAVVDVANDSIAIIDANASSASKKESIADLVTAMAGTGLTASSGQLTVSSTNTATAMVTGGNLTAVDAAQQIIAIQVFS